MYEFSIATEIVDRLLEFQVAHPDQTILKALVEVGELTCIDPRQLQFIRSVHVFQPDPEPAIAGAPDFS